VGETATSVIRLFQLGPSSNVDAVRTAFSNKTTTWSTTTPPDFRLYSSDSAEAKDVKIDSTDISGVQSTTTEIGIATQDVVTDSGAIVVAPSSNSAGQKVVVKVPSQLLKVKAYIGKLGAATGQTYKEFTPVTVAVAKLDTELTATDKAKSLVVVGGPCVNKEAANAMNVTFPACGAASGIPSGAALIKVVKDYPAAGEYTVVIAGWEAANTRTACSVVQQYATLLAGQTATAVKVTAATAAGITAV